MIRKILDFFRLQFRFAALYFHKKHPGVENMYSQRPTMHQRRPQPQGRRRKHRGNGTWLIIIAVILVLGFGMYAIFANEDQSEQMAENNFRSADTNIERERENPDDTYLNAPSSTPAPAPTIPLTQISTSDVIDTRYLALVNHQHPAPADPASYLLSAAWPTVAVSRIEGMYLHNSALRAVSEMFASARFAEVGAFFVSSGFRDFYRQAYLFGDGTNSEYVMPPGHSEHQTGLAADILSVGLGMHELANAPEGHWLANNSYRYGLILRYPQGAESITGINFEPWHFRYVGRVHAYYMMQMDFVLEEYIAYIHERGHFSFDKDGTTHYVLFQRPTGGNIYVPYGRDFLVSGDNKGGYIVWTTR